MLDREPRARDSVKTQSSTGNVSNGYFAELAVLMNGTPEQIRAYKLQQQAKADIASGKHKDPQPFKSNFYLGRGGN